MRALARLAAACALALWFGCEVPPSYEEPPLFQAYDPSVTCPSDQVGWDLSTGGGLEQLERNSVGDTVKVRSATLTNCGLTETDLRTSCDGQGFCRRDVTCDDAAADVTYLCGTESTVYKARVEGSGSTRSISLSCGAPITIVKAIYAPTASAPADISLQLSARCSGKRRCSNGVSGYQLNNYGDPAPNQSKVVRVTYLCGTETTQRSIDVDDFQLDFTCPQPAPKPMREPMRIAFARPRLRYGSPVLTARNDAYAAELFDQISKACVGKNECEVTFTGKLADGTTPPHWKPNDANAGWYTTDPDELGWPVVYRIPPGPWLNIGANYLIVGYTCGSGTLVEKRAVDPMAAAPNNVIRLKCGEPLTVTAVESKADGGTFVADPLLTGIVKARCDGRRTCTPPGYVGTLGPGRFNRPDGGTQSLGAGQTYRYTCGSDTTVRSVIVDNAQSVNLTQIECPAPAMDLTAPGIRLVSVEPPERTLEVSRLCTSKDQCTVPSGVTAQYRCVDSPAVKSSATSAGKLTCGLPIFIQSVSPSCYAPPPRDWCGTAVGSCNFVPTPVANGSPGSPGSPQCPARPTVTYTCGCDPTVRTVASQIVGEARLDCPALSEATACSKKACVPKFCYGAKRRDGNLQCVDDSTLVPTFFNAEPVIVEWRSASDGGTDLTPPAGRGNLANTQALTIKSDYPYQPFTFLTLQTEGNRELDRKAHVALWAYDEFTPKTGAKSLDGGTLPSYSTGFRCVVSETGLAGSPKWGTQSVVAGGTGQTFHPRCFDQDRVNDPGNSTFDAAARVGMTDGQFRDRFTRSKSYVTVSLDPHGVATVPQRRIWDGSNLNWVSKAVNPVGFFYDPKKDYLSLLDYYSQTSGEAQSFPVDWVASTEIELAVLQQNVSYGDLLVDVEDEQLLPEFDVDTSWFLRGDAPANPYSMKTRVAGNPAGTSLADRNLRLTVEMARRDPALTNIWTPTNSVRFPAKPISGGNNFLQTDRAHVVVTPQLRKRLLSVRKTATSVAPTATPDGFMASIIDGDTTFLVRSCLDFDGADRAIEADAATGVSLPALNGYSLKVSKRCTEPRTVVFRRQLFVRPTVPAAQDEVPADRGAVQAQGDRDVGGPQSNGVELGCIRQCTVNTDCGEGGVCTPGVNGMLGTCNKTPDNQRCRDTTVAQGGMGGQFPISLYEVRTQATVERTFTQRAAANTTNTCTTTRGGLLTFTVSEPNTQCTAAADGPIKSSFQTSFSPNIQGIIDLVKAIRSRTAPGGIKPDASKATNVRKAFGGTVKQWSKKRKKGLQEPAEGVAVGISKEFFVTIGPVPISIELSATAGFGFKFELERESEQAKSGMTTEFYPCVNNSNTSCYTAESDEVSFDDALARCNQKGGSLAYVATPSMNTQFTNAMNGQSGVYWIGAQSQYLYAYPPCADGGVFIDGGTGPNGTFSQGCKDNSGTGYVWLRGGGIASQAGLAPAVLAGSNLNNAFTNLSLPASFVPDKAALTYAPGGGRAVSADRVTTPHKFACGYDSATEVYTSSLTKKFSIEFGIGIGAALCLPSSRIGVCAVLEFKIFEASWSFGSTNRETNVYRGSGNARYRQSVFGENQNFGVWERKALEGSFNVELRFFFFSQQFKVKEFGLVRGDANYPWNGDIFPPATTPYFNRKAGE